MALSPTSHARQTVLTALRADAGVLAKIAKASIYPTKTPASPIRPFIRYGASSVVPQRASCWSGGDVSAAVHVFVGQSDAIPDPEIYAGDTLDAIAEAIDAIPDCYVERTQLIPDAEEPDVTHGIAFFTMKALAEA